MDLFAFPVEIRLKIYSELLIHLGPIKFSERFWGDLSSRLRPEGIDLCPTLLRASKQVYNEAIPLLYSDNRFRFSDLRHTSIAAFIRQIGAQASLLRHVCIDFPTPPLAEDYGHDSGLQENSLENLDLLRDACPRITTLELSLPSEHADFVLLDSSVFTELLNLIHAQLEAFLSLQEVKVDVKLIGWDSDEESDDGKADLEDEKQEEIGDDRWKIYRDSLRQLCSRGWAVNITKVPPLKEASISPDDMFDEAEWRLEQEREDEEWAGYYRQRQLEGYSWGYADDGGPA
jgi:hypothetical protein